MPADCHVQRIVNAWALVTVTDHGLPCSIDLVDRHRHKGRRGCSSLQTLVGPLQCFFRVQNLALQRDFPCINRLFQAARCVVDLKVEIDELVAYGLRRVRKKPTRKAWRYARLPALLLMIMDSPGLPGTGNSKRSRVNVWRKRLSSS